MTKKALAVTAILILAFTVGCSKFKRENYMAIQMGMEKTVVVDILGEPSEQFSDVYIYLDKDPMKHTAAHIYFDDCGAVIGKKWEDLDKTWENHQEGKIPN